MAANDAVDFKFQFYNLQGTHINERKKNFYKLLKSTSASSNFPQDQLDIQPRNYQEHIFYVDVLIHFRHVEKLIEILKQGMEVLSSRILKQKWFFQEAFKDMSEGDIVNVFLPTLSFSLRMKVLKKLSLTLDEERMDKIFDLVLERYGRFIAQQFLFSCSSPKIIIFLENNEITLTTEQLKRIFEKDIEVLKVYFKQYKKNTKRDFSDYHFLSYLVWKRPDLYFEMGLNDRDIKLGYYTTKAVINTNRDAVLNDIKNSKWKKSALVREIRDFDKEYLFQFFPKSISSLGYGERGMKALLFQYPIKKRWDIICHAFKQAYNQDILEYLDVFREDFFFPKEIKETWAEKIYLKTDSLKYFKYYEPKKGIKLLKDKINVTSSSFWRGALLKELVTVCHHNQDYSAYKDVLNYICVRHRNDDNVRIAMISHIAQHIDYRFLTEDHWQYLNEIINIERVKNRPLRFEIISEYLLFIILESLPLDEPVLQFVKDCVRENRSFRLLLPLWKEQEGIILRHIERILPSLQLENEKEVTYKLMYDIMDFNTDIKNNKILNIDFKKLSIDLNECSSIIDVIKEDCSKKTSYNYKECALVKKLVLYNYCLHSEYPIKVIDEDVLLDIIRAMSADSYMFDDCIFQVIKKLERSKFENSLLDYYFNNDYEPVKPHAVEHFLAKEPEVVAKYFSVILSLDVKQDCNMLDYDVIKKYSHLELDKQLISHFKDLVSMNSNYEKKSKLLNALARIMDAKSFLDLVKDYSPDTMKLDLTNQEQMNIYQLQCDIAKVVKKLDEPLLSAPVIMHYSQGDYLQSSLSAFYKLLFRLSEDKALACITEIGGRAVSARKHAVFLGFQLLTFQDAISNYLELYQKETNTSAKKYFYNSILKFFLKNPVDTLLQIVFSNMKFINKNDTELIQTVVESIDKIPDNNKPLFIEEVWSVLQILEDQELNVLVYRKQVLRIINDHGVDFIIRLSEIFCVNLINQYFLPCLQLFQSSQLDVFVINYLLTYSDEARFEFIFNKIKTFKDLYWESDKSTKQYVLNFFQHAYAQFDKNNNNFLYLFEKFWQPLFSIEHFFSEYILLRLMVVYKENPKIEMFAKKVDKFFEELIEKYGPYISQNLFVLIQDFFWKIRRDADFNFTNLALYLLDSNCSEFNYYVAFSIIKNIYSNEDDVVRHKVVDILRAADSAACRMYCNILLREFE